MKNPVLFLILYCLTLIFACKPATPEQQEEAFVNPLPGAWKMTAWLPEDSTDMVAPEFVQYKFYTAGHFFFLAYDDNADTLIGAGGGTYTALKDTFTENLMYVSWDTNAVKLSYTFTYQVKDGKFEQRGTMASTTPDEPDFKLAEDYEYAGLSIDTSRTPGSPSGLWRSNLAAYGDATEATTLPDGDVIYKLITPTHFYVCSFQPTEGRFRGMVFGTWEIRDGKYVERLIVGTWDQVIPGMEVTFDYSVSDTQFEQKGAAPTSDGGSSKIEEYYTRVE